MIEPPLVLQNIDPKPWWLLFDTQSSEHFYCSKVRQTQTIRPSGIRTNDLLAKSHTDTSSEFDEQQDKSWAGNALSKLRLAPQLLPQSQLSLLHSKKMLRDFVIDDVTDQTNYYFRNDLEMAKSKSHLLWLLIELAILTRE